MTPFEVILVSFILVSQTALAVALILLVCKKEICFTKRIITENKVDEVQKRIAEANIAELKRYNDNAEKANQEHSDSVKNITEALQDLMGVNDGD